MQAHERESILSYFLSVHAWEKTKPPLGGSQAASSTLATNEQTIYNYLLEPPSTLNSKSSDPVVVVVGYSTFWIWVTFYKIISCN